MSKLRLGLLLALSLVLFSHLDAWFTPNPSSRGMLVASLVEHGSYHVDRYRGWSEDKALIRDHYYSDKAPLSSWVTLPAYALASRWLGASSKETLHPAVIICGSIMAGVLPTILFMALLLKCLRERNASPILTVLYVLGAIPCSMIGVYAGTFFGHILAGLFLALAWRALFHREAFVSAGVFLGLSSLAEFPMLLFIPFFILHALIRATRPRATFNLIVGLAPGLLLIITHNLLTTGKPLEFAYRYVDSPSFQHMKVLYGFRLPSLSALVGLIFSPAHGLLFSAPIITALGVAFFSRGRSALQLVAPHLGTWSLISFVLLVSSYQMWDGGWAFGPRHLIPVLMVLLMEGVTLVPKVSNRLWQWGLALVCLYGGSLVFFAKATSVYMIPSWLKFPLTELLIPKLLGQELNPNVVISWFLPITPGLAHILWAHLLALVACSFCWMARKIERSESSQNMSLQKTKG